MKVQEAIAAYRDEHVAVARRGKSWKYFAAEVVAHFGADELMVDAMMPAQVAQYIGHCRSRGNSPQTLKNKLSFLSSLCRLCTEARQPVAFPRRLRDAIVVDNDRERVLTDREKQRLAAELHKDDYEVVEMFFKTGARSNELGQLRVADCHFGRGEIVFKATKNGRARVIPMVGWVRDYCARAAKAKREFVLKLRDFEHYKSRASAMKNWKDCVLRPAVRRAGIEDWRLHDARHSCTTALIEAGAPEMAVTKIMGWQSGTYIRRYTNLPMKSLQSAMALLDSPKKRAR